MTDKTSKDVRKETKRTRVKRVEFDYNSSGATCHVLRSGTRETVTVRFPLLYPREFGGGLLAEPSSAPSLEFLLKFLSTIFLVSLS